MRLKPADEISHKLFIATNLVAGLYIACTTPSWLNGTAIVAAANIIPVLEAIATGTARRCLLGNRNLAGLTSIQWSHRGNWGTFFYYPTISPDCMSTKTAESILRITQPLNN